MPPEVRGYKCPHKVKLDAALQDLEALRGRFERTCAAKEEVIQSFREKVDDCEGEIRALCEIIQKNCEIIQKHKDALEAADDTIGLLSDGLILIAKKTTVKRASFARNIARLRLARCGLWEQEEQKEEQT